MKWNIRCILILPSMINYLNRKKLSNNSSLTIITDCYHGTRRASDLHFEIDYRRFIQNSHEKLARGWDFAPISPTCEFLDATFRGIFHNKWCQFSPKTRSFCPTHLSPRCEYWLNRRYFTTIHEDILLVSPSTKLLIDAKEQARNAVSKK